MLASRRVLVGVTGSIAAYKTAELVSSLVKDEAQVRVVMTRAAREFVGPATFRSLTGHAAAHDLFGGDDHIALAAWAELIVVAPATAHFLARAAHGMADDLLSTILLAARAPLLVAPAMNTRMLEHPQVKRNLERVRELGAQVLLGSPGRLACGTEGVGRMAEPSEILDAIRQRLTHEEDLEGRSVLIAAGRTEEPIDPVRYLSNRSSGKTGAALAREALARGARVTLVWGPAEVEPPAGAEVRRVRTAEEMKKAVEESFAAADITIMAAAVADFRPAETSAGKIRRGEKESELTLRLRSTPDILGGLARHPSRKGRLLVGFALETGGDPAAARSKLDRKGLDLLVWNDPTRPGCEFGSDGNQVAFLGTGGDLEELPRLSKAEIAGRLFDRLAKLLSSDTG